MFSGVLSLKEKKIKDIMVPFNKVTYSLDLDTVLTEAEFAQIRKCHHSRVPIVFDKKDN
jgi:CBS domain containing-hemolysin-like protein